MNAGVVRRRRLRNRNMTQKNARKNAARDRQSRFGGKYAAHYRAIDSGGHPSDPVVLESPPTSDVAVGARTLEALLAFLRAPNAFVVSVGRTRSQPSATASVAFENARRLAANPQYFAETGPIQASVTLAEYTSLLEAGAADDVRVQVLRSFKNEHAATFSQRCRRCHSYIWCGNDEHEGACACGQAYRIVFDCPNNWELAQGWRCMDCGQEHQMREWVGPRQPWHTVNERQTLCDSCFQADPKGSRATQQREWFERAVALMKGTHSPGASEAQRER